MHKEDKKPEVRKVLLAAEKRQGEAYLRRRGATKEDIATVNIVTNYLEANRLGSVPEVDMDYVTDEEGHALVAQTMVRAWERWEFHHPHGPTWIENFRPIPFSERMP